MPIVRDKAYLHGNVTPSFFHYQHIQTAKGLKSSPVYDFKEKDKKSRTFRAIRQSIARTFPSILETLFFLLIIILFIYGLTLFIRAKYFSEIQPTELWKIFEANLFSFVLFPPELQELILFMLELRSLDFCSRAICREFFRWLVGWRE